MANTAAGLAFVSKMMIVEVFFHPERDIYSPSGTDSLMMEISGKCTENQMYFCMFLLLVIDGKEKRRC